jgi:hypothetical protein
MDAYDGELRAVVMPTFAGWRQRVLRNDEPLSLAGAIDALEEDLSIARDRDATFDERQLSEWLGRLRASC